MTVQLEQGHIVLPTGSMIKGSRPFYWILLKEANLYYFSFSSVCVVEWPPFGKKLLTRSKICSLCILTFCNFNYFPFWFGF